MTTIVLCGSARFREQFRQANYELSRRGFTVLTLADGPAEHYVPNDELDPVDKITFDLVYFEKIRMADAVLLIDSTGMSTYNDQHDPHRYIGFSTAREILWATMQDRPVFSFSVATGWGYLATCFENRFDETFRQEHAWILDAARQVLRTDAGVEVVQDQIKEREHNVMHAMLSIIACASGTLATMAEVGLREIGLDPMEDVETALAGVVPIPTDRTIDGSMISGLTSSVSESAELMAQIPVRKLLGAIIMVQAVRDMGTDDRIGQRRKEMVAKLAMTSDTLLDSFGVRQADVDRARETNGGMDFPIAE